MAVSVTETETKYDAPDDAALPRFAGLPQVASAYGPDELRLVAEYYDTEDLRLIRAGITLRRRTGGGDAGWHLKLPVGPNSREEIRLPLGRAGRRVPGELADLVLARTRGEPLVPVATISTRRQVITLVDDSGRSLAEVADDDVVAEAHAGPASHWREIEVELTGGNGQLLTAADKLLRRSGLRRSGRSAKLERVLGNQIPGQAAAAKLARSSPAYLVVLAYLGAQTEALKSLDPMVRRSVPDSVHKMRVATRRLRSTLRSFDKVISPAGSQPVADELKWLGTVLGEARDAEVQARRMEQYVRDTDIELILGPVEARVQAHFAKIGAAALSRVSAALKSERYYRLLDDLDALIADPQLGADAREPAVRALPMAARRSYDKTRRRMRSALRAPEGRSRDIALHQARKTAKQARYAGEVAAPVLGKEADRFASAMMKLQSVLGDHQDTVVGRQLARQLGVSAQLAGESAFPYGLFYGRDACDARQLQAQARKVWHRASRARSRRWMAGR